MPFVSNVEGNRNMSAAQKYRLRSSLSLIAPGNIHSFSSPSSLAYFSISDLSAPSPTNIILKAKPSSFAFFSPSSVMRMPLYHIMRPTYIKTRSSWPMPYSLRTSMASSGVTRPFGKSTPFSMTMYSPS